VTNDKERRLNRWVMQAGARALLPEERVAWCLRRVVPGRSSVDVWYADLVKRAHYKNLEVCGSVWQCPICASKISERRRVELTQALDKSKALDVALCTFTLHHDRRDKLPDLVADLLQSHHRLNQGKAWERIKRDYNIVGSIRALEVTHWLNGWHPHLHVAFFARDGADWQGFGDEMRSRWLVSLEKHGRRADSEHGFNLSSRRGDLAKYIAKWGHEPTKQLWTVEHELTKAASKVGEMFGHRTPTQLLADYALHQDKGAGNLWKHYAVTFKGKRQLWWSHGLRRLLGLDLEQTDEQIALATDEPSRLLAQLSLAQWRVILAHDARGELLEIASDGEIEPIWDFINALTGDIALPVRDNRMICDTNRLEQIANLDSARKQRIKKNEWFKQLGVA